MEEHRPRGARALRPAHEGVPRRGARARRACSSSRRCSSPTRSARPRTSRYRTGASTSRRGGARAGGRADRGASSDWDPTLRGPPPRRLEQIVQKKRGPDDQGPGRPRAPGPCPTSWPRSSRACARRTGDDRDRARSARGGRDRDSQSARAAAPHPAQACRAPGAAANRGGRRRLDGRDRRRAPGESPGSSGRSAASAACATHSGRSGCAGPRARPRRGRYRCSAALPATASAPALWLARSPACRGCCESGG